VAESSFSELAGVVVDYQLRFAGRDRSCEAHERAELSRANRDLGRVGLTLLGWKRAARKTER
jgi:hypothetical protein